MVARAEAGLLLATAATVAFGGASDPVTLSGRIDRAPCARARAFVVNDGRHFELRVEDTAHLPSGLVTLAGRIHPKVSVCRAYPWFELFPDRTHGVSSDTGIGDAQPARGATAPSGADAVGPTEVRAVCPLERLPNCLVQARQLARSRTARVSVRIEVPGADIAAFERTIAGIALNDPAAMTLPIELVESDTPLGLYIGHVRYGTWPELAQSLADRDAR